MKTSYIALLLSGSLSFLFLASSCGTPEERAQRAEERRQLEEQMSRVVVFGAPLTVTEAAQFQSVGSDSCSGECTDDLKEFTVNHGGDHLRIERIYQPCESVGEKTQSGQAVYKSCLTLRGESFRKKVP